MSKNFKKMLSYYKPYRCIFWADMFFATVSAAVAHIGFIRQPGCN